MIPTEAKWWQENQNRTQRVQIAARVIPLVDYTFITQDWLTIFGGPPGNIPTAQFQSPTFPSSQPVLLEWAVAGNSLQPAFPGSSSAVSVVGFPSDFTHAMTGDPLASLGVLFRGCVIVQWSYQGVIRSQVCDAQASTLAISLADWVAVTVLAPDAGEEGPSIVSFTPFLISVYPNHGGRRTTATITTAPQDLSTGADVLFPVYTWANVDRWRWWWFAELVAAGQQLTIGVADFSGLEIQTWYEIPAIVPPQGGATALTSFERDQRWPPGAAAMLLRPTATAVINARVRAYIKSEV